jgi:hypothetical protein
MAASNSFGRLLVIRQTLGGPIQGTSGFKPAWPTLTLLSVAF